MRIRLIGAVAAVVILSSAACSDTGSPRPADAEPAAPSVAEGAPLAAPDPAPEVTGEGSSVGPDGATVTADGTEVVVPKGAVPEGASFSVPEIDAVPAQPGEIFGRPVGVEHEKPLAHPVTVTWTLPELTELQRASLVLAKWDPEREVWVPRPDASFEIDGDRLTAELADFSFWDWIANAGQTVGEVVGARRDAPHCDGALPSWVRGVVDPDEDTNAAAVRVCFEADGTKAVTTRVVNNRPFTQVLHMTQGHQEWAWTWPGQTTYDVAATVQDAARTVFDSGTTYLLPALSETAVGIGRPAAPGSVNIAAQASVDWRTLLVDVVTYAFEQVSVGGIDNPLVNALAQAVYECGAKQLLGRPELDDPGRLVGVLVDVVGSCATAIREGDSEFGQRFEQLSRAAMDRLGPRGDDFVIKANRLTHEAASAFRVLSLGEVAFFVADELQNAVVGPLTLSVRADGQPQELGAWTASCSDQDIDSDRIYRNLALRDEFSDKSRDLWQFPQWASSAAKAVRPLTKCTADYRSRLATFLPGDWGDAKAARVVADAVRGLSRPSADPHVVRFDGIGDLSLRLTAADLRGRGYVDIGNLYEGAGAPCVRYSKDGSGLAASVEYATGRVLAITNASGDEQMRTEVGGIRVGSTLAQVRAAFHGGTYRIEERLAADFGQGANGVIVNGPGGSIGLGLDDASAADYAAGRARVSWVAGVGLPGEAPTAAEDGC